MSESNPYNRLVELVGAAHEANSKPLGQYLGEAVKEAVNSLGKPREINKGSVAGYYITEYEYSDIRNIKEIENIAREMRNDSRIVIEEMRRVRREIG